MTTSLFKKLDAIADAIEAKFDRDNAKDDSIGGNGGYTFTIADLLRNDVNAKAGSFFFGNGLDALKQVKYMADHGIIDNHNGTYTATAGMDFTYSVLTGKGLALSYSEGSVDVKAPPPLAAAKPPTDDLPNNAAKDDVVGLNDDFVFTLNDLLGNDPGGANKNGNLFFGDVASQATDPAAQAAYLASHGITKISDADGGTYQINTGATDFNYFVQIGNNGTWSKAHVTVADSPDPVDTHHNGALAAEWTFENHAQSGGDNVGTPYGFWNLNQWAADHPGVYGADADSFGFSTDIQVHGVDGHRALDTAASPGNIFLQAIPEGRGGVLGQGATMPDLEAGKQYHAEVSILKQDFSNIPEMVANGTAGTDPDAWVSFQFNDKVLNVHASDINVSNEFVTFDLVFDGVEGEDGFTIMSHGTNDHAQGLLIDSIQIHDWIV